VQRLSVFEEVEEGGGVSFECHVRACPPPAVTWYKDDVHIQSSSVGGRVVAEEWPTDPSVTTSITSSSSSSSRLLRLVIRDARKDDEGAYRCNAENEEGVAVTTGYLSVTGVPHLID